MKFSERLSAIGFACYDDYLASDAWSGFKKRYKESGARMDCLICSRKPVQLHHRTYERVGQELFDDVIPVCREHHVAIHEWLKANGKFVQRTHEAVAALGGVCARPQSPKKRRESKKERRLRKAAAKAEKRRLVKLRQQEIISLLLSPPSGKETKGQSRLRETVTPHLAELDEMLRGGFMKKKHYRHAIICGNEKEILCALEKARKRSLIPQSVLKAKSKKHTKTPVETKTVEVPEIKKPGILEVPIEEVRQIISDCKSPTGTIVLTKKLIHAVGTGGIGFTNQQLSILGLSTPLAHGWMARLVGTEMAVEDYERLLSLKGHRRKRTCP
jgi:hypothetical protein